MAVHRRMSARMGGDRPHAADRAQRQELVSDGGEGYATVIRRGLGR